MENPLPGLCPLLQVPRGFPPAPQLSALSGVRSFSPQGLGGQGHPVNPPASQKEMVLAAERVTCSTAPLLLQGKNKKASPAFCSDSLGRVRTHSPFQHRGPCGSAGLRATSAPLCIQKRFPGQRPCFLGRQLPAALSTDRLSHSPNTCPCVQH